MHPLVCESELHMPWLRLYVDALLLPTCDDACGYLTAARCGVIAMVLHASVASKVVPGND